LAEEPNLPSTSSSNIELAPKLPEHLSFSRPIPRKVRDFGRAIDPKILEAGDLLLFHDKQNSWTSRKIVQQQSNLFPQEHACWSHVAVSGGGYEICEATLSGVKAHEYWEYMTDAYDIKIRRVSGADAKTRSLIAYYAATGVGTQYGYANLPKLFFSLTTGKPWGSRFRFSSGVVCSQLYFEACMRVGFLLNNIPSEHVCPAHLSQSSLMKDIDLEWVAV
jgi:hypothetical protein